MTQSGHGSLGIIRTIVTLFHGLIPSTGYDRRKSQNSRPKALQMDLEKLIEAYMDAWNSHDTAGLLKLFHKDASYYDAFWMETCVGKDLAQYLNDALDAEQYWYQQYGVVITIDDGAVFRYSAHNQKDSANGQSLFTGAHVFVLRDNKIFSVSDFYCDPNQSALE